MCSIENVKQFMFYDIHSMMVDCLSIICFVYIKQFHTRLSFSSEWKTPKNVCLGDAGLIIKGRGVGNF